MKPHPSWNHPCEEQFVWLAYHDPKSLVRLISSNTLEPFLLTFAAEHAGKMQDTRLLFQTLEVLLNHPSAIVREGAIIGLASCYHESKVRNLLSLLASHDPSPAIRTMTNEILEQHEKEV